MNKIIISLLVALVALTAFPYFIEDIESFGSIETGQEYNATTTRNYRGTAMPSLSVLKTSGGSVGSVVITGAGAGTINLYDATSTVNNTEWATTTIASIPVNAGTGTYTLDASFVKGLIVEIIGTAPTSTITWR